MCFAYGLAICWFSFSLSLLHVVVRCTVCRSGSGSGWSRTPKTTAMVRRPVHTPHTTRPRSVLRSAGGSLGPLAQCRPGPVCCSGSSGHSSVALQSSACPSVAVTPSEAAHHQYVPLRLGGPGRSAPLALPPHYRLLGVGTDIPIVRRIEWFLGEKTLGRLERSTYS